MLEQCKISGFADEIHSSFEEQIRVLTELGQKYLELRGADGIGVADLTDAKAEELKRRMKEAEIGVSAIGSPIGKIGITDDFEPHFESFKRIVELAHLFETPYIRMFSFYVPDEKNPEAYREEVFARMERFVQYAEKENVILLHENEKGIYGAAAQQCRELLTRFYGDHFQGIFDFANFVQCRQNTLEAYEMLKPYISYFHIKDALWENGEVVLPGEGDGNLAEILGRADKQGYNGFLSLEPHLFHFQGFDRLENGSSIKKEGNGAYAFRAAHRSLMQILGRRCG